MNTPLSHNDPDLRLARNIGSLTESGLPLAEELRGHSRWMDHLLALKADQPAEYSGITWDELASRLNADNSTTNSSSNTNSNANSNSNSSSNSNSNSITSFNTTSERPQATVYSLNRTRYLVAAAAVLLLALLISIFLYTTTPPAPALVESGEAQVEFTAPDGSLITLRPYTTVRELSRRDELLAYSVEGEAYFDVVHDPAREFRVETGDASVSVLGTRFTAGNIGGHARVWLQSGSVLLTSLVSNESVVLEPGYTGTVGTDGQLGEPRAAAAGEAAGWLNNEITFIGRPVAEIVAELEHHFNIRITIPAALATDTISGRIMLDDAATALDDAGMALGGRFEKRNDGSYGFITQ